MVPKPRGRVSDGRATADPLLEPRMQQGQKVRVQSNLLVLMIMMMLTGSIEMSEIGFRRFSGLNG